MATKHLVAVLLLLTLLLQQPPLQSSSSSSDIIDITGDSDSGIDEEENNSISQQQQYIVDEFYIFDPMQLHDEALSAFQDIRRKEPNATMDYNSTFMKMARTAAVKHLAMPAEEELKIYTALSGSSGGVDGQQSQEALAEGVSEMVALKLPMPSDATQAGRLAKGTNDQMMMVQEQDQDQDQAAQTLPKNSLTLEVARAHAVAFVEDVGEGAISKAGALPMGPGGQWLKLAEDKLHREAQLNYHELLWEIGSELVEERAAAKGVGLFNASREEELLAAMKEWFVAGGGELTFVEPRISSSAPRAMVLVPTEEVAVGDVVVSVPLKLVMCRQTARNVLLARKGKYLGDELAKTFEKNELHGMMIFVLHEYFKEVNGKGSKWGPYIRSLRMRFISSEVVSAIRSTRASQMYHRAMKACDEFMWWSVSADGPCAPNNGICRTKPEDKWHGDGRFAYEHMRWAYWVVKQNAVRVHHSTTGLEFIALVPFYNMVRKEVGSGGGVSYERDGSIRIRAGKSASSYGDGAITIHPGNLSDPELFLRHLWVPPLEASNPHNFLGLSMPGALKKGSKFHYCLRGTDKEKRSDACMGTYKGDLLFWKSQVLGEWRLQMNLPPRLQDVRLWAHRLHLYGTGEEEKLLNFNNKVVAGLPLPVEDMSAEEQLMLLGLASTQQEAALMVGGSAAVAPQLYSAPDSEEDPQAKRAMEELAYIAARAQNVVSSGNTALNATMAVINRTRDFFLHGVLPKGGLDELDEFLMKKIGLIGHCGFAGDMRVLPGNVTQELLCAMRVHLMNEADVEVFCPHRVKFWEDTCSQVEFGNSTAISLHNELNVIGALRRSIEGLFSSYPSSAEEDRIALQDMGVLGRASPMGAAVLMRLREKELLFSALAFLDGHELAARAGEVPFQLEQRARERAAEDAALDEHRRFMETVLAEAALPAPPVATLQVDVVGRAPLMLSVVAGRGLRETVIAFCRTHNLSESNTDSLEKGLRARVLHPPSLDLLLGVVISKTGDRRVFALSGGGNSTAQVRVFCARQNITATSECDTIRARVQQRVEPTGFTRRAIVSVPVDAPDGRKLHLVVREGEQHDVRQLVADFFEHHSMSAEFVDGMALEVTRRLPRVVLEVPIQLQRARSVSVKFAAHDNVTNVVGAFVALYEIEEESVKVEILTRARAGLAPGSFVV